MAFIGLSLKKKILRLPSRKVKCRRLENHCPIMTVEFLVYDDYFFIVVK